MNYLPKLCRLCSNPIDRNGKYCKKCIAERRAIRKKNFIESRIRQSRCIKCGNYNDAYTQLCNECKRKVKENNKNNIQFRKDNHLCIICKTSLPPDVIICNLCNEKRKLANTKYKKKIRLLTQEIKNNEIHVCLECLKPMDKNGKYCIKCLNKRSNESKRRYVINKKKDHLCSMCSKPLDRKGYRCTSCINLINERQKELRKQRIANKLCVNCHVPLTNGKLMCEKCIAKKKISQYKYNQNIQKKKNELKNTKRST